MSATQLSCMLTCFGYVYGCRGDWDVVGSLLRGTFFLSGGLGEDGEGAKDKPVCLSVEREIEKKGEEVRERGDCGGLGKGVERSSCLRYYLCALSAKNAVPVAQAPCQHIMTEGTVHRITVLEKE